MDLKYIPKKKLPIEEFLKPQGRFKRLFAKGNEGLIQEFQDEVDRRWQDLMARVAYKQDSKVQVEFKFI